MANSSYDEQVKELYAEAATHVKDCLMHDVVDPYLRWIGGVKCTCPSK